MIKKKTKIKIASVLVCLATLFFVSSWILNRQENFENPESIIIVSKRPEEISKSELRKTCRLPVVYTEEEFLDVADLRIELDEVETKKMYKAIRDVVSTKKVIATISMPVLDLSFLSNDQKDNDKEQIINVSDSLIFINYILYKKIDGEIVSKLIMGGSNIIRIDEKFYEVNIKKMHKLYDLVESKISL